MKILQVVFTDGEVNFTLDKRHIQPTGLADNFKKK